MTFPEPAASSSWSCPCGSSRSSASRYQTAQRFSGGLTIAAPVRQANARWNSGKFERGPMTRNFGTG